jgi:RNA 3'-terminal phosphate cyclase
MITNQKIDVGDVSFSRLSQTLRFTLAANLETIQTIEDITGRTDMSAEEVAEELAQLLSRAIQTHYSRGGMRIKYD